MKKLNALAIALLASLAFTAPAHATLIDGFGDNQAEIEATADDPGTPIDESTASSGNVAVTDTDLTGVLRSLTVTQAGSSNVGLNPDGGSVTAKVASGLYQYSQDTLTFGTGTIDWTFDSQPLSSPVAIVLSLIEADNDLGTVTFTLNGGPSGPVSQTLSLPEVDPSVDPAQALVFNIGGFPDGEAFTSASLFIDGSEASALDLTVDFVRVPAPGVLGLLGIGLVGLGIGGRRRRNTEATA